jgi:hypothetical protein
MAVEVAKRCSSSKRNFCRVSHGAGRSSFSKSHQRKNDVEPNINTLASQKLDVARRDCTNGYIERPGQKQNLPMTMPYERTKAVIETRELLQLLASSDDSAVPGRIHDLARQLLRHFPLDVDLDVSAAALPNVWATVNRDRQ